MLKLNHLLTLVLIPVLLNITGCWSIHEPEKYTWISWLGLDRAVDGKIRVNVALTNPHSRIPTGEAPPEQQLMVSSDQGDTIFDAVRNINAHLPKRLFWPYLQAIIISEDLARSGVNQYLDMLFRNVRARKNAWVIVTKGDTDPIFQIDPQIVQSPSKLINNLVDTEGRYLGESAILRLKDFQNKLESPGFDPVVGVLGIWDQDQKRILPPGSSVPSKSGLGLDGSAVFRGDKLVGWLSPDESLTFNLAIGKIQAGLIVIPNPENPENLVGIEIINNKAKLKAELVGEQPKAILRIDVEGIIGDLYQNVPEPPTNDPMEDQVFFNHLKEGLETKIRDDLIELLTKSQTKFDSDILGVGDYLMNRFPNDWDSMGERWSEIYKEAAFDIEVNVRITSSNIMRSRLPKVD